MRSMAMALVVLVAAWGLGPIARAADGPRPTDSPDSRLSSERPEAPDTEPHPVIPQPSRLPGVVVILILGLFLAAAVVGIAVRQNAPEPPPPTTTHDEPDVSHGHGDAAHH